MRHQPSTAFFRTAALILAGITTTACHGVTDLGSTPALPAGLEDPATFRTPAGALQMYWATVGQFQLAFAHVPVVTGLLTDELTMPAFHPWDTDSPSQVRDFVAINQRTLGESARVSGETDDTDQLYTALQLVRTYAVQGRGALAKYNPAAPAALRGELFALQGYAEVYLADLYCSGVPLSELEFEGDYTYKPGSTTQQIYAHAITLFDSALALAADSARVLNLARVGKARALASLSLDSLSAAARVAALVPTGFTYSGAFITSTDLGCSSPTDLVDNSSASHNDLCLSRTDVSDHEGGNGLAFRSAGDPRTQVTSWNLADYVLHFPAKYGTAGAATSVVIASGVEARLIEAEAALRARDTGTWLGLLNALRTDGTYVVNGTDTVWNAGTGGVAGLRPLPDPGAGLAGAGADRARVDLLFAERAAWLFVDGHRQSDLRRLVRQYARPKSSVYPSGPYGGSDGSTSYGTDVTAPVPSTERTNPLFHGCFNREA